MIKNGKTLPIHYDELVVEPKKQMQRVLNFMKLDWDENVINYHKVFHTERIDKNTLVENEFYMGNTPVDRTFHTSSLCLWETNLTPEEIKIIMDIAGDMNTRLMSYFIQNS
jgi:hypothetical protein